jgi:signal transduction histidine kinase
VALKTDLDEELPSLRGDSSQLHQVFLNLVMNALDAMPEGGELRLATRSCLGSDLAPSSVGLDCSCAQAEISDTGVGIPADRLERIFDPFYTTKGRQRGTGLGLAIAREIVHSYSGQIVVDSRPGEGSRFVITIPQGPCAPDA